MTMDAEKDYHPLRHLRNLFITGLLVLVPLSATALIVFKLFDLIDRGIRNLLKPYFSDLTEMVFNKPLPIPPYGIGLVLTVLIILFVGMIARNFIGRRLILLMEIIMLRVPLVNKIYLAIKQISEAILQRDKNLFQKAVLIEYPRRDLYSIGFLTSEAPPSVNPIDEECVCVFVATTPNPTSGVLVVVPKSDVIPLDITVEEAMKLVISGGVVHPDEFRKKTGRGNVEIKTPAQMLDKQQKEELSIIN
jgi:uncharacterized membrane protein